MTVVILQLKEENKLCFQGETPVGANNANSYFNGISAAATSITLSLERCAVSM
jgi:hypothetical protein